MGRFFDWGDEKPKQTDEHVTHLGAESAPSAAANPGAAAIAEARQNAETLIQSSPRRRGRRPRTDSSPSDGSNAPRPSAEMQALIAQQLESLHDPDAWGALLCMPADAIAAFATKKPERWAFSKEERKTLGITGAGFARTLMITNPRALALMMLSAAVFSAYAPRALQEFKEMAAERAAKKKTPDASAGN